MHSLRGKKPLVWIPLFSIMLLACGLSGPIAVPTNPIALPTSTIILPSATSDPIMEAPSATPAGREVSLGRITMVLPEGLASGVQDVHFPRAEGKDLPTWSRTPGHTQLRLVGYPLQAKAHEPQIYVFPAQAYAELIPGAFESIHRLDNILYGPGGAIRDDGLPSVPFFNAQPVFASNIKVVMFQNGGGVRLLTQYAQYPAPANNCELFYHFQGLSRDGEYYILAVLPITVPVLAESSDPAAALPVGGIPYSYYVDQDADMEDYYTAITNLLDAAQAEAFTPSITQLDALIQSLWIMP